MKAAARLHATVACGAAQGCAQLSLIGLAFFVLQFFSCLGSDFLSFNFVVNGWVLVLIVDRISEFIHRFVVCGGCGVSIAACTSSVVCGCVCSLGDVLATQFSFGSGGGTSIQ